MLGGFFAVYLVTPLNLTWQLATSLDRLLLQLWPMTLFGGFLLLGTERQNPGGSDHLSLEPRRRP